MEIWRDVEEWGGLYQVSNLGRVRSVPRVIQYPKRTRWGTWYIFTKEIEEKILSPGMGTNGYQSIKLFDSVGKRSRIYMVHRLVATAFIPNPDNLPQVNHLNNIRDDNRVENLEWVTRSDNMQHASRQGRLRGPGLIGSKHPKSTFTEAEVRLIRKLKEEGKTESEIARQFGRLPSTISHITSRRCWKHLD